MGCPSSGTQGTGKGKKKSSLQSQAGLCTAATEIHAFTLRVRNSFVLAQTVLFRKAQAGFEDTQCSETLQQVLDICLFL